MEELTDIRFTINCSPYCTMHCNYCKQQEQPKARNKALSLNEIENSIEVIKNLIPNYKNIYIHFNGQDVFLDWNNLIKPFIEKYSNIYKISIHSNGILLFPERVDFLNKHNIRILLSLDGPQEVQDINRKFRNGKSSFDFVYNRLKMLKEKGSSFSVVATFNQDSINYIEESFEFLMKEKVFFSILFDTKYSIYDEEKLKKFFSNIARTFVNDYSLKEQESFRDYYRSIFPNESSYHFSVNLHGISAKLNKHTFKTFLLFGQEENSFYLTDEVDINSFTTKISSKCGRNKGEKCLDCPAFHGVVPPKSRYDMEIYCMLLTSIFKEQKEKKDGIWKN